MLRKEAREITGEVTEMNDEVMECWCMVIKARGESSGAAVRSGDLDLPLA